VKSSTVENSMERLSDVEVPNNGNSEPGLEVSTDDGFEWAWLLWLNRRLLGKCILYGLIIGTVIAFLIPKEFESTTELMPPDAKSSSGLNAMMMTALSGETGGSSGAGPALGNLAGDLLGMKDPGAVYVEMLHSRTVKDGIIAKFDLRKVYGIRYWEGTRKQLAKRTAVSVDRKSGVITITVTDRDPQRAALIAQAYVDELNQVSADVNTSAAHRERMFIEERLKTVKQDLAKAAQDFSEYASKNATLDIKEEGIAMVDAAAVLQGQLIAAQSELDGLQQVYTDSNVRVRSLRARVEELQRQLKKVGGSSTAPVNASSQEEFPSIRNLPLLGVRWLDLYRENKIQETVYEMLTEQLELVKIEEAKETPVVKVLDLALVPEKKSSPHRLLVMFGGMVFALTAGSAWILNRSKWERLDPQDPRKQLGEEILAKCMALSSETISSIRALAAKRGWKVPTERS
jgi:capsule polysaccharide export protein KpsE/RkpR